MKTDTVVIFLFLLVLKISYNHTKQESLKLKVALECPLKTVNFGSLVLEYIQFLLLYHSIFLIFLFFLLKVLLLTSQ